ncbi:hypothetical protein AX15_002770 [Amanita polypyramis BW_CC]|nr:hypothetical protein AX15_002770 [Amanita polypyramis BW_CC]
MATTNTEESWHLTAIRVQGLRLMYPERSWRPIVTIEIDKHNAYEYRFGSDGHNPNYKDIFQFNSVTLGSILEVKVWCKSQSKKKRKKRSLVATAAHSLGELLKKQEVGHKLEVRLQCQTKCALASKGKPQNGALLHIRLRPPPSISTSPDEELPGLDLDYDSGRATPDPGYASNLTSSSDTLNEPPSPTPPLPQVAQSGLRRRRIRGYAILSDEEPLSEEYTDDDADDQHKAPTVDIYNDDEESSGVLVTYGREIRISDAQWVAACELPQYVEDIKKPSMIFPEQIIASFTVYREMKEAVLESHYEKVFTRLQQEWTYVGGLLVALAALNTGAFSLSANSIFRIDPWCRSAIATSSISTGLGIACDTWFLFRYNWTDLQTFITRAKDVFDSYFFFSLSARVPALCMVLSGISLMVFLGIVAYGAWPGAVLVISFLIGVIMTLQFLAYTAHWCATKIVQGGRAGSRRIITVARRFSGSEP